MGCDFRKTSRSRLTCALSVSSNGSNGLRPHRVQAIAGSSHLSVSSNGSNGLRPRLRRKPQPGTATFSILERIEWAATYPMSIRTSEAKNFQYPRTDRMGCDALLKGYVDTPCPFQYPRTDRMGCDAHGGRLVGGDTAGFQYPRTDRMGCDLNSEGGYYGEGKLSVSSNGSNGLRQAEAPTFPNFRLAFSILERIEWAATRLLNAINYQVLIFQYPRTDRMGCDRLKSTAGIALFLPFSILERIEWAATRDTYSTCARSQNFQYPRTDRMGCDLKELELRLAQ